MNEVADRWELLDSIRFLTITEKADPVVRMALRFPGAGSGPRGASRAC